MAAVVSAVIGIDLNLQLIGVAVRFSMVLVYVSSSLTLLLLRSLWRLLQLAEFPAVVDLKLKYFSVVVVVSVVKTVTSILVADAEQIDNYLMNLC